MTTPDSMSTTNTQRFQRDMLPLADQVLSAALRLTGNRQDAEDLTQEVMLHAYAGMSSFRDGSSPKAWLHRILHNAWISQYRRRKCRPDEFAVDCISDLQWFGRSESSAVRSAEDCALEAIADTEVVAAMRALSREVQMTVYYADVLELSCKQIAAVTGCPIGTVMSRLHRGRKQLRISLSQTAVGHGLVNSRAA
jgi:RNA polymerase sigma-70 factor (ECF subfamily)